MASLWICIYRCCDLALDGLLTLHELGYQW